MKAQHRTGLLLLLSFALVSCRSEDTHSHREGQGPLSVGLSQGGASLDSPGTARWHGIFGSALPCTKDGGNARIVSVTYDERVAPLEVRTLVRFVRPDDEAGPDAIRTPIGTLVGSPNQLARGGSVSGSLSSLEDTSMVVSERCGDHDPSDFIELLTVIESRRSGALLGGMTVTYEYEDETFALHTDWDYATCGHAVRHEFLCSD